MKQKDNKIVFDNLVDSSTGQPVEIVLPEEDFVAAKKRDQQMEVIRMAGQLFGQQLSKGFIIPNYLLEGTDLTMEDLFGTILGGSENEQPKKD